MQVSTLIFQLLFVKKKLNIGYSIVIQCIYVKKKSDNYTARTLSHLQLHKHLHCPLFYDWADAVQIFTEAANCRTQHLNLRVGPFGSETSSVQKERVGYNISTKLKHQQSITAEDVVLAERVIKPFSPCRRGVCHWMQLHGQFTQFRESSACSREDLAHLIDI